MDSPSLVRLLSGESDEEKKSGKWGALMPLGIMGGTAIISSLGGRLWGSTPWGSTDDDDLGAIASEIVDGDDLRNAAGLATSDAYKGSMQQSASNVGSAPPPFSASAPAPVPPGGVCGVSTY